MQDQNKYAGVWPVMLTPFTESRSIDWDSLERLIDWYIDAGVHGLFASCQSSEVFFLSDRENYELTRFVVEKVDKRVPVVASGHTATHVSEQLDQIAGISETGVDAVILISNRFAQEGEASSKALECVQNITENTPLDLNLGVYECPYPYKRLMDDAMVSYCATSGRFVFIKDTSCDLGIIEKRLRLIEGSRLQLANANAQTLLRTYQLGGNAYSGVMANFHPELYVWLHENWKTNPELALKVSDFLTLAAGVESFGYPVNAKAFHRTAGRFDNIACRSRPYANYDESFFPLVVDSMTRLEKELLNELRKP
ncbi:dihydrodipicolinate synthase family protein [Pseudovibrio exalbescens]|uniref:Dihydrodipicolinate synthase family protein n=1 Tax=Pseudovibrio exalbescens TaxID=197461 RepID=A0A1U7JGF9_9HYPH|nr:dihydrodipicolinate synthase family protein [Pseudovibrio exalbescens]OKL43774.1 dihydrodipicolinate synthase family protein [Pseudovibrio exalbescens]